MSDPQVITFRPEPSQYAWTFGGAPPVARLTPPLSYMAPAVGIWMIIGLIYLIYLYARHKQRITEVGTVHLDPMLEYPSE